jgi:GrpB-like predicted nucleotidyltransferase (UPF0157 family)
MILIQSYDPSWPEAFRRETAGLRAAFGNLALRIDHVGSTSVPGLAAKPVIDIQVSVSSAASFVACHEPLARVGYRHVPLGDFDRVYPFFRKPADWPGTHHVHLCASGSAEERRHLAFCAYLRDHPAPAAAYVELKRRLAAIHDGLTQESRERYSLAKTDFVESVLERAIAEGYPRAGDVCKGPVKRSARDGRR